jgi:hypothetical protein
MTLDPETVGRLLYIAVPGYVLSADDARDFTDLLTHLTTLEREAEGFCWVLKKIRGMRTYRPPTDDRSAVSDVQGWMHVLEGDRNTLMWLVPEADRQTREIAALQARLAQVEGERETFRDGWRAAAAARVEAEARVTALEGAVREARQWIATGCDHFENNEAVVAYLDAALGGVGAG